MNDDWRSRNTLSGRDAAKAAAVILGLLFGCILLLWVVTRALKPDQPPDVPGPPATRQPPARQEKAAPGSQARP
jgi:hypothetical protein